MFHIINHATFKAGLFMSAGIIDHETGTRDLRKLAGLMRYMPATATLGMLAAASMAGVPLLNGFLSKGNVFCGSPGQGRAWLDGVAAAAGCHAGGHFQRGVFAALYPRHVLQR